VAHPTRFAARLILSGLAAAAGVILGADSLRSLTVGRSWPAPGVQLCVLAAGLTVLASMRLGRFQLGDLRAGTGARAETQRRRGWAVPAGASCSGDYGADESRALRRERGNGGNPAPVGATGDAADYGATGDAADYGWYGDAGDGEPGSGYGRPDRTYGRPVIGTFDPVRQSGHTDQGNSDDHGRSGVDSGASGDVEEEDTKRLYGQIAIYTLLEDGIADFDRMVKHVVEQVRVREPGTLVFVAHSVPSAPLQRIIYGVYRDQAAYDQHAKQSHVREFEARRQPLMLATNVIELGVRQAKVLPLGSAPLQPSAGLPSSTAVGGQGES
jgi:quinol monooxygenase YgiN